MGIVTFLAAVFFHGRVAVLTFGGRLVTALAIPLQTPFQQVGVLGGVGIVTLCTVAAELPFTVPATLLTLVAIGAKPRDGLFDQPLYGGGMGVMAGEALSIFYRDVGMGST